MTTSNTTWTNATGIPASGTNSVASITVGTASTALTATTTPSANNSNGYNVAASASATSDRVIATAPTGVTGSGIQLAMTNGTGATITSLRIAFDTIRYNVALNSSSVATNNELPGYWLFVSTDGTTWTNVTANPTITTVPNTAGTTSSTLTVAGLSIANGGAFYLRWLDDNAQETSPDQISGLNNVVVTVPDGTWTNASGGSWATPANWSGNVIPVGIGKTADFNAVNLTADSSVTLDGATTIGNMIFGDTTPSNNWTLATGSAGPLTLDVSTGTPSIAVNNQSTTISAVLAGTKGLQKAGAGTLVLSGANTYYGTTTVSAGTLTISAGSYSPSTASLLTIGGASGRGVFNMNSSGTVNFTSTAPSIGGAGGATDTGTGAINQTAGTLNLTSGSSTYLTIGNNNTGTSGTAYGSYNLSGGTLTITSGSGIRNGYGGMGSWVQSGGTLNCGRYFVTGGGFTSGKGVATFTGGTTTVNSAYRIHLSDNAASNGTLNIGTEAGGTASVTTLSTAGLYVMAVAGGNTALNLNSGTLTLGGPILKGNTGTTALNLNGGTLKAGVATVTLIDSSNSLVGNIFKGGFTVDTQSNAATINANLVATTGLGIYPSSGIIANAGSQGSGYIGAPIVTVSGGSGSGAAAIANVSGGQVTGVTLTSPGQNYVAGDVLTFTLAGGGATTPTASFSYTLQATDLAANSGGGLTKIGTGTLTVSGANTYTGSTRINAGTLLVNGSNTGAVTTATGGTLGGTGTIGGAVNVQSGGTLAPGVSAIGTLTMNNSVTLSGTTQMEISKSGGTLTSDRVSGITTVTYGGTLVVTNAGPDALVAGNIFTLFSATTRTGSFTSITLPTLASGLTWDTSRLSVDGTIAVAGPSAPTVTITAPTRGASFASSANIVITVNAADADGTVAKVEFFAGATKIGESSVAPFSFNWNSVASGAYTLTAKATDDSGLFTTSSAVNLTVNNPPSVTLAEPTSEQIFNAPASIRMSVNAADSDGIVTKVEYYASGTKIGESVTGPSFEIYWNNVLAGSYNVTAKATDDIGATTVSSLVHITVQNSDTVPAGTALADIVDTMFGVAAGSGTGSTVPGPCLPQSSIYPSPDTVTAAAGGFSAGSDVVGFAQLHATGSGSSTMSYGNFLVSPRLGANTSTLEDDNGSPITNVTARPYSYRGRLTTPGIDCTVVPTANCAIYQFDFPASTDARLYFDVARKENSSTALTNGSVTVDLANGTISGGGTFDGNWNPAAYNVYFYAKLDTTPASGGTWVNNTPTDGALTATTTTRQRIGSWVKFDTSTNRTVRMKIGVSFQSVAKAQQYVEGEIPAWDSAGLEAAAKTRWNDALGAVQTPGISFAEARKLYTSLFHSMIQPRNRTGDPAGWAANAPFWDDQYTPWDTWQTLYPLLDIVSPGSVASIVNSFGERFAYNGKAETAFIMGKDFQVGQGGDEVDRIICDAYVKGIPGIDWAKIWPLLQFNAGRRTPDYINLGFVSTDGSRNGYDSRMASGSSSIAFAHGDWCAAQVGAGLGHTAEAQALLSRSGNWRNVWDASLSGDGFSGFIHGKARSGTFTTIAATSGADFYQGTCWNYSFNVFDRNAMIDLMGGRARFIQRLEFAFGKNSPTYLDFSNEVNLQAVPLLARASRPNLGAFWADNVRQRYTTYSYPGDEDSGALASLYFFLTAGFVPSATEDTYYLHGPRVPQLEFNVGGGKTFTVTAANSGGSNIYVQSATLDGQPLNTPTIHHSDITAGKTLAFVMGPNPTTWGTGTDFTAPTQYDKAVPVSGPWTAALGTPQITNGTTTSPVWGTGPNGADNTAISSSFPDVLLSQAGSSMTLSATVKFNGLTSPQSAPSDRFAWGLFNDGGQAGATGWTGYLAANDTTDAAGTQKIWRKDSGNSAAFYLTSGATAQSSFALPTPSFADDTYTLVMMLTRTASGAIDYYTALKRNSDGVLFSSFTGSDLTPTTFTFNRVGLRVGDVLDADSIEIGQCTVYGTGIVTNTPPTVALTEPDPEQVFDAPASIYMTADAADSDGTISKVEYYANNIKIGEATTAPYAFFWNNVYTGSYTLTAKAFDDGGASTTSGSLHVSVTNIDNVPPAVAVTAPASGVAFAGNITITASASDTDGTVSKVEFFNGATKLGESTTAPYSFAWNSVAVGNYTLTAKATDNDGGVTTSNSVSINVQNAPVSFTQNFDSMGTAGTALPSGWSFYGYTVGTNSTWVSSIPNADVAGGTANATLIATTTFDAANTKSATQGYNFALSSSTSDRAFGTSPTSTEGVAIQWSVTNTSGTAITAIRLGYDTRRFTAAATANELPGYWLYYSLDNGTTWTNVAALNPTLSGPTGVIVPNSIGTTTISPTDITLSGNWGIGSTLLLRWVDDNAVATSADQIIGLDNVSLTAAAAVVGTPPTVTLTAPLATDSFVAPATVNLAATAADTDGTISKVEFYNGGTKLGEATSAPYTYSWTGVASGTYSLTARAFDNDSNSTTSAATSITVNAAPGSGTLTRGPYLQMARPTGMTVRWRSSQAITGRVKYGTSAANLSTTVDETSATTEHIIDLTGLAPNTTYFYSVGSAFDTLAGDATTTFSTPPVVGTAADTRVWVLGDAGTASANQTAVRDAFYTWTGSRTPNMVLQLGDNAYNSGLDSEFQAGMFNIYGTMLKKSPFWSCLGNHETNQATSFVDTYPYFSIYTFPTNGECGGVASGTEHYYSWNYGNIHFISLDSMTASRSPTGAMATWLTNDLASTTAIWIVCIFHHPPYTKGSHNSDTETELIEMRQNILPILEAGGVDLVLSGHSHCYERSYLLDGHYGLSTTLTSAMKLNAGDGRPAGNGAYMKPLTGNRSHFGSVYAVAGSAGQISGGSLNHPAHFLSLNNLGSLVLDVNGTTLNATFVKSDGTTPDTFSMVKQGGSTAPIVSTAAATNVSTTTATLNASVNPTGTATTAKFESGTTGSYGTNTTITLSPNDDLTSQTASITLTGLTPDTTYHYRISATNTWGTVTGLDVQFTTAKTAYQVWAESAGVTGTNSGPTQNKDSDGLTNLEEYAFGTNPNASDSGPVELNGSLVTKRGSPTVTVGTNGTTVDPNAVFCRRKDASSVGLTYTVQFSSDLGTWVTSTVTPTVIADDGEYEVVKVHYPFSVNGRKAQFFHIVITAP